MLNRTTEDRELVMNEIIKSLFRLNGQGTRKEIKTDLAKNSSVITKQDIDNTRPAKDGKTYKPFDFVFNYAVIYLEKAGYVKRLSRSSIILTDKCIALDPETFDSYKLVTPIIDKLQKQNKKKLKKEKLKEKFAINNHLASSWQEQLLNSLAQMNPQKFEEFSRGLLTQMGVEVDKSIGIQYTNDGGLDGFGYVQGDDFRTTRVALQAKRWTEKVSSPEIDKFRGAMDKYNAEFGICITNSSFTEGAIKTARAGTRIITLIDGKKICDLVAKYNFHVKPVVTYKLDDFYKA